MENNTENKIQVNHTFVKAWENLLNLLATASRLQYGTKMDFVCDHMDHYLNIGVISKEAAMNSLWKELNIKVEDHEPIRIVYKSLFGRFRFRTDRPDYPDNIPKRNWDFEFKKVILPKGWYLHRVTDSGDSPSLVAFSVFNENNEVVGTMDYFNMSE